MRLIPRLFTLTAASLALAACAGSAAADITVVSKESTEGMGGFANSSGTTTWMVSGQRGVTQQDSKFSKLAGGSKKTAQIVRLDKGLMWLVDSGDKEYSEVTFEQMRAAMRKGMEQMKKAGSQMQAARTDAKKKMADSDVKMDFKTDVKRTGEKLTIAGASCERVVVTATSEAKSDKKDEEGGMQFVMDTWYAKKATGGEEIGAFMKSYMQKLGMQEMASGLSPMASAMYGDAIQELGRKMEGLGYPMKSTFTVSLLMSDETKAQMTQGQKDMKKSIAEGKENAKKEDKKADAQDAVKAGSAVGDGDAKGLGGALGGFLGRKATNKMAKKMQDKAEKMAEGMGDMSSGVLMKSTTEVVSISHDRVAASQFEVPAGFKQVKPKLPGVD